MKLIFKRAVLAVFSIVLLVGCNNLNNEGEPGIVSIRLAGGSSVSRSTTGYPPSDYPGSSSSGPTLAALTYKVYFNGTEKSGNQTADGSIQFTVKPGTYEIRLESYELIAGSDVLYATGNASNVIVQAGQTTQVPISMREAATVIFQDYYGVGLHYNLQVGQGDKVTEPDPPTNPPTAGYTFDGWLLGPGFTVLWDFANNTVTADITLKAIWNAPSTYTVTFNSMGGSDVPPMSGVVSGTTISAPTLPTSGYGAFVDWYSDSGRTTTFNFSTAITGDITLYAKWNAFYNIGDTGPGLGKIFYRDEMGFSMTDDSTTAYYLEAALADMGSTLAWASGGHTSTDITGTGTAIGEGRNNTVLILATDAAAPAASACDAYSNNGKTDWFLPSKDELNALYTNRGSAGIGSTDIYWSSSQYNSTQLWCQHFTDGHQDYANKSSATEVRAIRAF